MNNSETKPFYRDSRFLLGAILLLGLIFKLYGFHKLHQINWDEIRYRGYLPYAFLFNGRYKEAMHALFYYAGGTPMLSVFSLIPGFFAAVLAYILDVDMSYQTAIFFHGIIWTVIAYLIYRAAKNYLTEGNSYFALIPPFFLVTNMACTIHSRNLFPSTVGMLGFVVTISFLLYADRKDQSKLFLVLGLLFGLSFTLYNGFYMGAFFLISYFLVHFRENPLLILKRVFLFSLGAPLIPILFEIIYRLNKYAFAWGYFEFLKLGATYNSNPANFIYGDFSEGKTFYFKYFWAADGVLSLLIWAILIFGGYLVVTRRANRNFKIIYIGIILILTNHVVSSAGLKKMILYGRQTIFIVPFTFLLASFEFKWLHENGFKHFFTPRITGTVSTVLIILAAKMFYPVSRSRYPFDEIQSFLGKASYRLIPFKSSYKKYFEMLEYKIHTQQIPPLEYAVFGLSMHWRNIKQFERIKLSPLYKYPNPYSFPFRQYEGMTPKARELVNSQDLSITIYRYRDIKEYYGISSKTISPPRMEEVYLNLEWWPLPYLEYRSTVRVKSTPALSDLLPPLKEKIKFDEDRLRLIFTGKMSRKEREMLMNYFPLDQDRQAIDTLFEKSQHVF